MNGASASSGGSSPRVRGTRHGDTRSDGDTGIIPACAGNTKSLRCTVPAKRDHPRVCGEHSSHSATDYSHQGSSPRVRGTLVHHAQSLPRTGIIPACAGNTLHEILRRELAWDHPRVCGEHLTRASVQHLGGIIPACAGNTPPVTRPEITRRDHPRVCGEHLFRGCPRSVRPGSSPRVRGTRSTDTSITSRSGIIPACAGNTPASHRSTSSARDHPRMCGEHSKATMYGISSTGSSPHVRGTQSVEGVLHVLGGIIPACAGNTNRPSVFGEIPRDHPRMCGEHIHHHRQRRHHSGSSPHVRGTQVRWSSDHAHRGIIPACAGNTAGGMPLMLALRDHPRMCGEHIPNSA